MASAEPITNEKADGRDSPSSGETAHEQHSHAHPHFAAQTSDIAPKNEYKNEEAGNEKVELTEEDCYEELGFSFPNWKKWTILTVIFWVQVSMNFNTSLYSNALTNENDGGIVARFNVSEQGARVGAAIFLITYAFGCELWAPWSEGRKTFAHFDIRCILTTCFRIRTMEGSPALPRSGKHLEPSCRAGTKLRLAGRWSRSWWSQFCRRFRHSWYDCRYL